MKINLRLTLLLGILIGSVTYISFRNEFRGVVEYTRRSLIDQQTIAEAKNASPIDIWAPVSLKKVASGFRSPVYLTNAGDGSERVFIVEKGGIIYALNQNFESPLKFLDITDRVRSNESERGLLSVAFHPKFKSEGRFFVYYTDKKGRVIISEFNIDQESNLADKNSEKVLLKIEQPYSNHNGGQLDFGPDGYLYIGTGDGGAGGDPYYHGQNLNTLLGKILRLDVDDKKPYGIPGTNPFVKKSAKPEIWSYGLRNPWRFSFDRNTGDLYIADVGQNRWEEIDFQPASSKGGENYGWNIFEGFNTFKASENSDLSKLTMPILEYSHDQGCSVTGGYVYRGSKFKKLDGTYLYADFCSGKIWGLKRKGSEWNYAELLDSDLYISSFGIDESGEIYLMDFRSGNIYQIISN